MKKNGFSLMEFCIVIAILGFLAAITIPSFMKAKHDAEVNANPESFSEERGRLPKNLKRDVENKVIIDISKMEVVHIHDNPYGDVESFYSIGEVRGVESWEAYSRLHPIERRAQIFLWKKSAEVKDGGNEKTEAPIVNIVKETSPQSPSFTREDGIISIVNTGEEKPKAIIFNGQTYYPSSPSVKSIEDNPKWKYIDESL